MKLNKYTAIIVGIVAFVNSASATVTINTQFGQAQTSNTTGNTFVPDGTLWALIVSADNTFAGGFGLDSSLSSVFNTNEALINSTFAGKSIALGTVFAGDTVFALGGFNGASVLSVPGSTTNGIPGLSLGTNGLATGLNFAFLYFPGVSFAAQGDTYNIGSQIGGVNRSTPDAGAGTVGMIVPADSGLIFAGASTNAGGDLGGSVSQSQFVAVNLIPEPSAAILGALGALGLLRRRRI